MRNRKINPVVLSAAVAFAAGSDQSGPRAFEGVAYGGGIVTDHPWFDRVIFDLKSTTFETPAPALYRHGEPVGVIEVAAIAEDVRISGKLFSDSDESARGIAAKADAGFPWQMSVGIYPGAVDEIGKGSKVKVNGKTFEGPLTVFRNNRIRETSFVALGADSRTAARIFEANERDKTMDELQELKDKVARLEGEIATANAAKAAAEAKVGELEARFEAERKARRLEDVKSLFSAIGREFKDAEAAPYVGMTDEQFSAVAADLRARPKLSGDLAREQATEGAVELKGTAAIQAAASAYIAEQAKLGRTVSVSDAVTHVTAQAKKAA